MILLWIDFGMGVGDDMRESHYTCGGNVQKMETGAQWRIQVIKAVKGLEYKDFVLSITISLMDLVVVPAVFIETVQNV